MEKGEASPYRGWFCFDDKMPYGYHTFGDWRYMPKLNLQNEDCAQYFLSVGRYWLEKCHVDGWRLDVSPEVWPDFWRQFKTMMRKVNPDSLMVAECWDDSREWLTVGDMFDSTMHYVLSRNIWSRFCRHEISTAQFDCALNRAAMLYPQRTQEVLWTFLGSHDTQRIRTRAGGDLRMVHAASFFQFTYLGSPIIYYGDELGMEGGEDPDCRRPMRWDDVEDNPTRAHYQKLRACAHSCPRCAQAGSAATWLWKTACTPSGAKPIPSSCSASSTRDWNRSACGWNCPGAWREWRPCMTTTAAEAWLLRMVGCIFHSRWAKA